MARSILVLALALGASAFVPSTVRHSSRIARPQVALASTAVEAPPHGGKLIDLMITDDAAKKAAADSCKKTLELTPRQLCDVELIANFTITEKFCPDKAVECKQCYGTSEIEHPGSL